MEKKKMNQVRKSVRKSAECPRDQRMPLKRMKKSQCKWRKDFLSDSSRTVMKMALRTKETEGSSPHCVSWGNGSTFSRESGKGSEVSSCRVG